MATTKELRAAAERLSIRAARPGDSDVLVQHILSTTRDDDGDAITPEWYWTVAGKDTSFIYLDSTEEWFLYLRTTNGRSEVLLCFERYGGLIGTTIAVECQRTLTTRGAVRTLLAALGVGQ